MAESSPPCQGAASKRDPLAAMVACVRQKGVRLWLEGDRLRYAAPRGVLAADDFERLRECKDEIVELLRLSAAGTELQSNLRSQATAPLAYSQLAHWHLYRLNERPAIRQVASAMRLRGRLHTDVLLRSVGDIVRRHDALRTRIVFSDGEPLQQIDADVDYQSEFFDLTPVPAEQRERDVERLIEQLIMQPIDVATDPLFGVRLVKLAADEHLLIIAMEHMIGDGLSLNILGRDLFTTYVRSLQAQPNDLPSIPMQFVDYARWQRSTLQSLIKKHLRYWDERLHECQRLRFPQDETAYAGAHPGWATVPLRIDADLTARLREWCRVRRTTVVLSVFAVYVALVLRWCKSRGAVFQFQSDGRFDARIENAVGYFATVLYLRLELLDDDNLMDLTNRVVEEYCQACEHTDLSYLAAQIPSPDITRNAAFNWLPQGSSESPLSELCGSKDELLCMPTPFAHPMMKSLDLDGEPAVVLCDTGEDIVGEVLFPANRFSVHTMNRFSSTFLSFLRSLLEQPQQCVKHLPIA